MHAYRFRGFRNVTGTVSVTAKSVKTGGKTLMDKWNQEIPLQELRPNCITMRSRNPDIYNVAIFSLLLTAFGIWSLWGTWADHDMSFPRVLVGAVMLLGGSALGLQIWSRPYVDWIIFPSTATDQRIVYTRTGPDSENVDDFTEYLRQRIIDAQSGES